MSETRDFWLLLRALADELQHEGDSDYERALSLAAWLEQMPAGDRVACVADLEVVTSALSELADGRVNERWKAYSTSATSTNNPAH